MKIRYALAAAAMMLTTHALAETTYLPCQLYGNARHNCTPETPSTGGSLLTDQMEQATYTDEQGVKRVATVRKYLGAMCKDNICSVRGAQFNGEFVGHGPAGFYIIPRGWYLSPASDGSTVAYLMGTGPLYNGDAAEVSSNGITGEACYEQKYAAFRQENGEDAMIIYDQINEWREQCGLPPEL